MRPNQITPVNPATAYRFHSLLSLGRVTKFRRSGMEGPMGSLPLDGARHTVFS